MKTTYTYDHYFLYEEIMDIIHHFEDVCPMIISHEVLLTTPDNHDMVAVTLTNKATGAALSKPAFYIDGNHHAGEVTGSMAAMHTLDVLCTNYGTDEGITKLLNSSVVYIIPRVSMDGAETYLTTPYSLRSVNRPYINEKEGLYQEDIDGDNVIRMMRIKSGSGAWKKDPDNPDMVARRLPDDVEGDFYDIYSEGMIDEFDGVTMKVKEPLWGLDFNRNYPFGWFAEARQPGAGAYPLSNPENKAVVEFVLAHPNIGGVATHHTSGGVILYPPGTKPEFKAPFEDMKIFKEIGQMGTQEMGYPTVNIFDSFMIDQENYSSGAFDDWCYQDQGIYAYTIELWDLNSKIGMPTDWNKRKWPTIDEAMGKMAKVIEWCKENNPEAFMPWTPVIHPQLGEIEIGGFNYKFVFQNPPGHLLGEEVEKTTKFMLRFAKVMPKLAIEETTVNKVAEGVYEIKAKVANHGYLPSYISKEAKSLKVDKPVVASLSGNVEFVSGKAESEIGDLAGYSLTRTGAHFYGNIATQTSEPCVKEVSWIVKGAEGTELTLTVSQPKMGTTFTNIEL